LKTLEKAITILELFSRERPWLGVTEIATELGLHKGTVHLILSTLRRSGYIIHNSETRKYGLGFKLRDIAERVSYRQDLRDLCLPRMVTLARDSEEDVSLSIPIDTSWVIIAIAHGTQFVRQDIHLGRTLPLYCGAGGRCILAFMDRNKADRLIGEMEMTAHTRNTIVNKRKLIESLEEIRARGYAVGSEEFYRDAAAVSVPLLDRRGDVQGSCTIHSTVSRMDVPFTCRLAALGLEAAGEMNETLRSLG
jgi:DNA-binding IclR family transcriptional regulator